MRKSFNGLSGIIENELEGNPINGDVFTVPAVSFYQNESKECS